MCRDNVSCSFILDICVVHVSHPGKKPGSICAGPEGNWRDSSQDVAHTRCSASRHLSWQALLRLSMSSSWCTDGDTTTISRLRSKAKCPVNITGPGVTTQTFHFQRLLAKCSLRPKRQFTTQGSFQCARTRAGSAGSQRRALARSSSPELAPH